MWPEGYLEQFGNRLDDFLAEAVPTTLAALTPTQREHVTTGAGDFPFDILQAFLHSELSYEDTVSRIVSITGTWTNAPSGSQWALARLQLDDYFLAIELCHLELTIRGVEQRWEDDLMDEVGLDVELRHRRDDGDDGAHDD